ncbi:MAG: AAA family ATPase [Gammaproteobacteria bacterium]|nr:AAA family ATPase [Gammaproteobacteria bacterium]
MKKKNSDEIKVSKKADRRNHFSIRRLKNDHGFYVYQLDNLVEGKRIYIPRFIFGRFRACIKEILDTEINTGEAKPFEYVTDFKSRDYFYFKSSQVDIENLIIQDLEEREGSSGYITVGRKALYALSDILYSEKLKHPNDVLENIITYHKIFQFSFSKTSKSITSDLMLRKDILQSTERYNPRLAEKVPVSRDEALSVSGKKSAAGKPLKKAELKKSSYQSKLGERFHEKNIEVDYDEIFAGTKVSLIPKADKNEADTSEKSRSGKILSQYPTTLLASDIKAFETDKFKFELNAKESTEFRDAFIGDRSSDFYLGFEIVDALFTHNKSVRTFRFPLYFMRINIRESGREVHLSIQNNGQIYLNHLALANLVEKFTDVAAGVDQVDKFFKTLLAQDISIDRLNDRIQLIRYLPVKELIFDRAREILFGYQDENGKGGILSDLKVKGIECDLQSVYLYRASKQLSPVEHALEMDLDSINAIAHETPQRFYQSLLGRFLTPELIKNEQTDKVNKAVTWTPGRLPKSSRQLMAQLDNHDLLLLEGPPGTGKTHTIMNLLIHAIISKQRVLVVSDQQAAIEALTEKLQDYLIGNDRGTETERKWNDLLFSAIKTVANLDTTDQTLNDLIKALNSAATVQAPSIGMNADARQLNKKARELEDTIQKYSEDIEKVILAASNSETAFKYRIPKKESPQDVKSTIEFLNILMGENQKDKELIRTFIHNRLLLVDNDMSSCYDFFKIPQKNVDQEVDSLLDDKKILEEILNQKADSIESLHKITEKHPRNELIRFLETSIDNDQTISKSSLNRLINSIKLRFKSPLLVRTRILLSTLTNQIQILEQYGQWNDSIWSSLRDVHESIRIGKSPTLALNFYLSSSNQLKSNNKVNDSVQALLEKINDLYQQKDDLVREGFVSRLREIAQEALTTKRASGTNNITSIMSLIDTLKQFNTLAESGSVFSDLKDKLYESFPIWMVRKQMVPFLLPCKEQIFDLVIVDEATQCRVDDALSLMFRSKKMLVVGDDKQTVLQKNSTLDDYLFKDLELDEHLRSTQAQGFKGGGSHIFGLVKSIKQGAVMLDEHYRCPPDIIEYSNRYVYDNELKIMQWRLPESDASVEINYQEQTIEQKKKPSSGKFKGIETAMIDRYMEYVAKTLKKIEKTTGKKINLESDVALCYFLMKNEPYVKSVKENLLRDLNRGDDILDGAGAALQGKERDYIFYLWDITRYNVGAFKQGDDADKRKGELNVLMSRPKKKAFHYLHHSFEQLEAGRTNITQYLSRVLARQSNSQTNSKSKLNDDNDEPSNNLLYSLLNFITFNSSKRSLRDIRANIKDNSINFRTNITVGDATRLVDLIAFPKGELNKTVGMVDLSAFGIEPDVGQNIVDYFFQLKRAVPNIDPVFLYPYELIDENSQTFQSLMYKLDHMEI